MRNVLVTGGNQGIGYALCKQLAINHNCHVYLTARNADRGMAAASKIEKLGGSVDFIPLDTSSETSIKQAVKTTRDKLSDEKLYGIVNNAGIGLNTGTAAEAIITTNLHGPKLVCENFLDLLEDNGRIVNLGSGSGPMYVGGCSVQDKKALCSPDSIDVTWEFIENHAKTNIHSSNTYGLSKALLACYTGLFAREHPHLLVSCVSPGFINTQMTEGWGANKSPDEGTISIKKCLLEELDGNGWYYGSDGLRSQYHNMRNPGEPVYDGVNPFL